VREDPAQFCKEYYEKNYPDYWRQNPDSKMRFYHQLVLEHTHDIAAPRLLDLGCAFGRFLGSMDAKWRRIGIDISEYAVQQAARSVPAVHFAVASCTAVPFRGPFHAIVAFDVIEHVPDLDTVAKFVNSELDGHGVFVFVVPVYDGLLGGPMRRLDKDPTHIHKNSREFWLTWAGRNFEVVSWTGIFRLLLPRGVYVHWPNRRLRSIAPAIGVIVRRRRS
jgi:SAM-dependent methyltransferase